MFEATFDPENPKTLTVTLDDPIAWRRLGTNLWNLDNAGWLSAISDEYGTILYDKPSHDTKEFIRAVTKAITFRDADAE